MTARVGSHRQEIIGAKGLDEARLRDELRRGGQLVKFDWAVSLFVVTYRGSSGVFLIRQDESTFSRALPYILATLLFGWWGIPFGPIWSVRALIYNFTGGTDVTQSVMTELDYLGRNPRRFPLARREQ